jgi:transposase
VSPDAIALLVENRALQETLAEKERALTERESKLASLLARITELERQIELLSAELRGAARERRTLEARLKELLAKRRALAAELAPGQLALFAQEPPATPPCAEEAPDGETGHDRIHKEHRPKREPREVRYAALPREHVRHELAPAERVCPVTKKELVAIGEKQSEELEYRPAKLVVLVHHHVVYGLSQADRAERKAEPIVAPQPPRPLEGALAGVGLLAWILLQKYRHHLPLYRQQAIFAREGLFLPRQTLCDWVLWSAYNLEPIQRALKKEIVESGVVQLDDTPVQCQAGKGAPNFQAHLWTYTSPLVSGVVFDFAPDRGHEHVLSFLGENMRGYLVGDGYAGYGTIAAKRPGVVECGCWAHVLRKWREVLEEFPVEAARMLTLIGKLFDVEAAAAEQPLAPDEVRALREQRSRPVLERIHEEVKGMRGLGSAESPMAKARKYLENQWPALERFLEDGRVPIHNNACETAIRPVAIGRRNWMFAGSARGGRAAATAYSLIESCRRVEVDPFLYLRDVLLRVSTHPAGRVHELVPARWKELVGPAGTP